MDYSLDKTREDEIKQVSQIYADEFSKPPYKEEWSLKKAIGKIKFYYNYYDLYTIKKKDQVVGFVAINPTFMLPGDVAFGEEFAIKAEFQNQGIGTWVQKELFKIYKKKGYKKFMAIVHTKTKAFKLYKKLGITPSESDALLEKKL